MANQSPRLSPIALVADEPVIVEMSDVLECDLPVPTHDGEPVIESSDSTQPAIAPDTTQEENDEEHQADVPVPDLTAAIDRLKAGDQTHEQFQHSVYRVIATLLEKMERQATTIAEQADAIERLQDEMIQQQADEIDALREEVRIEQEHAIDDLYEEIRQERGEAIDELRDEMTKELERAMNDLREELGKEQDQLCE